MTALEIIEETFKHYSEDTSRRGIGRGIERGHCAYFLDDKRKCAVGRCLTDEVLKKVERNFNLNNTDLNGLLYSTGKGLDEILKEPYRGMTLKFWRDLQHFHDTYDNWTRDGVTEEGLRVYNILKTRFA